MVLIGRLLCDGDEIRIGDGDGAIIVISNATFEGAWATATAYTEGQGVEHGDESYRCILGHTSGASTEPGVGASWETNWELGFEGDLVEKPAPDKPTGLAFNRTTGVLSVDEQTDASEWRYKGNVVTAGTNGARTRVIGTATYPTRTVTDSAIANGESRSFDARAYDDYSMLEGPAQPAFAQATDRKL